MRRALEGRATATLYAMLLLAAACAARQTGPEIVDVEHETRIGGSGVVSATDEVSGRTVGPADVGEEAGAGGSVAAAADGASRAQDALARAEAVVAQQTGVAAPEALDAPPSFAEEDDLHLLDVRRASDAAGSVVVVQLSRDASSSSSFELSAPRRCVVDVSGPRPASAGQRTIVTGDPRAPTLRVGSHQNRLRLVLDVAPGVLDPCVASTDGSAVVMDLGGRPQGAPPVELWTAPTAPEGAERHAAWVLASATGGTLPAIAAVPAIPEPSEPPPAAPEVAAIPVTSDASVAPPPPAKTAARDAIRTTFAPPPAPADADPATRAQGSVVTDDTAARDTTRVKTKYTGRRVSLEFKDADILNVLRIIADVAHRNIVATDDVKGQVTIVLYDVPWDQALDILLKSTGLEMVEYDDVITVSTSKRLEEERKARLAARQAGVELEPLQTEYIRVNYVKAGELARLLGGAATQSAAAAAATDTIVSTIADSGGQRRGLLSSRGLVQVNDATNTLIVRDVADGIANAKELVRKLDVQTPQVAIQGLIFEADTNIDRDLGIRWGANYIASPETGNPTGRNFPGRVVAGGSGPNQSPDNPVPVMFDFPASQVVPGAGSTLGLFLGSLSGSTTIDAEITALEQAGKGKVISRPKVITLNNAEAVIQSLEILRVRLPSTGTVINTGPGGVAGGQTTATQAIDTGIILRVTPQVSSDGYVLMQIFVKSSVPSQVSTDDIPNEISRQATSQVLVREGETVVIGGVYRQRANTAESGVPYLRTIPVLGWLFKNSLLRDNRQELLVFITPRIVWRQTNDGPLPTADELWQARDRSAYQMEPVGDGGLAPVAAR